MSTDSNEQSIAFMRPPSGLPIELIHYTDILPNTSSSPLQILLPATPGCNDVRSLTCALTFSDRAPVPSVITHFVHDLEEARRFWEIGVGFTPCPSQPEYKDSVRLTFQSVVPAWRADLTLVKSALATGDTFLDGPGFRCFSVISTDLDRDHAALKAAGGTSATGQMVLRINGKTLHVEIFTGPSGVMLELIRPLR